MFPSDHLRPPYKTVPESGRELVYPCVSEFLGKTCPIYICIICVCWQHRCADLEIFQRNFHQFYYPLYAITLKGQNLEDVSFKGDKRIYYEIRKLYTGYKMKPFVRNNYTYQQLNILGLSKYYLKSIIYFL